MEIQRDYLLKQIEYFFKSLNNSIKSKNEDGIDTKFDKLYVQFFDLEDNHTEEDILNIEWKEENDEDVKKNEILAELLYQDGIYTGNKKKLMKSLVFFEKSYKISSVYSFTIEERIKTIKELLK